MINETWYYSMTVAESIGIGLGFLAIVAPDLWPRMPRPVSYTIAGVGFLWLAYSGILALQDVTAMKVQCGPLAMIISGAIVVGAGIFWHISLSKEPADAHHAQPNAQPQAEAHPLVFQAQFEEMKKVESFFGGKDEMELRNIFDLPNILTKNIKTQNIRINFIKLGKEKEFLYNNYSDNGSFVFLAKEGHFTTGPSGIHVDAGPKDVLFLVTTGKFQMAKKQLTGFMNSALIPELIKKEISAFDNVINDNTEIMTRILDEKMHQDENFFIHYMDMGSPFYGVIVSEYAARIVHLKPISDRILSAISASWKISQ